MSQLSAINAMRLRAVVVMSILLLFFTVPHTLEDFATGEPQNAGIPAPLIALVVSTIFALQGLALYWLGARHSRGLWTHAGIGLFWPLASGVAQLPEILSGEPYRAGFISVLYVGGIIICGVLLLFFSVRALLDGRTR